MPGFSPSFSKLATLSFALAVSSCGPLAEESGGLETYREVDVLNIGTFESQAQAHEFMALYEGTKSRELALFQCAPEKRAPVGLVTAFNSLQRVSVQPLAPSRFCVTQGHAVAKTELELQTARRHCGRVHDVEQNFQGFLCDTSLFEEKPL